MSDEEPDEREGLLADEESRAEAGEIDVGGADRSVERRRQRSKLEFGA